MSSNGPERILPADEALQIDRLQQIRDILIGEQSAQVVARFVALEARVADLERDVARRLDALLARIEGLETEVDSNRRSTFEELSRNIVELGERIRRISKS